MSESLWRRKSLVHGEDGQAHVVDPVPVKTWNEHIIEEQIEDTWQAQVDAGVALAEMAGRVRELEGVKAALKSKFETMQADRDFYAALCCDANIGPFAGPPEDEEADPVHAPAHYRAGSIECIDAIESALGPEGFESYCQGNAIKYTWRYKHKGKAKQDLDKAGWYLERIRGGL